MPKLLNCVAADKVHSEIFYFRNLLLQGSFLLKFIGVSSWFLQKDDRDDSSFAKFYCILCRYCETLYTGKFEESILP